MDNTSGNNAKNCKALQDSIDETQKSLPFYKRISNREYVSYVIKNNLIIKQ